MENSHSEISTTYLKIIKDWSPFAIGAIMLYVNFVQLQSVVADLKVVVKNLDTVVQKQEVEIATHEVRIKALESNK